MEFNHSSSLKNIFNGSNKMKLYFQNLDNLKKKTSILISTKRKGG